MKNNTVTQDTRVTQLKSNPLYWASLGSRELFHSNFLGWLFSEYKSSVFALLGEDIQCFEVKREKHNIDLVLFSKNCLVAIENKVKDIPRAEQLRKYDDALSSKKFDEKENNPENVKKVLLTLLPPHEIVEGWKTILYQDLVINLEKWIKDPKTKVCEKHYNYIFDYIELLKNVLEIVNQTNNLDDYWFELEKNDTVWESLKAIRFEDTIKKLQASQFRMDVMSHLPDELKNHSHFRTNTGLNNKTASVDFIATTAKKGQLLSDGDVSLYVQIEGFTYRKAIEHRGWRLKRERTEKYLEGLIESLEQNQKTSLSDWLPAAPSENKLLTYDEKYTFTTKMRKSYNSYSPGFIYRYFNVAEDGGIPKSKLFDFIEKDLRFALELIEKIGR